MEIFDNEKLDLCTDLDEHLASLFKTEAIIKDIIAFSKEHIKIPKNKTYVSRYLNKKRIGFDTIKFLSAGLLPRGINTIIPRATLIPKVKYALGGVNNALLFPSFKDATVESFLGILRNTVDKVYTSKHIIWKIRNDGNRFFHWGNFQDIIILVEGLTDELRLIQSDLPSIPTNGTEFNIYDVQNEFKGAKEVCLFLDGDLAGRTKTLELVYSYIVDKDRFTFDLTVIKAPLGLDPCDLSEVKVKELFRDRELAEDYFKSVIKNSLSNKDTIQRKIITSLEDNF